MSDDSEAEADLTNVDPKNSWRKPKEQEILGPIKISQRQLGKFLGPVQGNPQTMAGQGRFLSWKKICNSDIFLPESVRPDWLKEDTMINSLPRATVANVIAQNQMTMSINKQNVFKEEKAIKSKGSLRKDEDIKTIKVT